MTEATHQSPVILVADDDAGILEVTKIVLETAGFSVVTTTNAEDTLEAIETNQPSLVLLDIWLAGQDGSMLARYLKSEKETAHLPIILLSANKDIEARARAAGADDFVAKPFDIDDLEIKVRKHLKK